MMNDELDVVEVRLNTLASVVEKFVIVEAPFTHSGKPKELTFENNKNRFEKFLPQIIHLIRPYGPPFDAWSHENNQRNFILNALEIAKPIDDLLFISDADEIPKPDKLLEARNIENTMRMPVAFNMDESMYYMNFVGDSPMRGPFLYNPYKAEEMHSKFIRSDGTKASSEPTAIRWHMNSRGYESDFPCVNNSGWHFSSLGGIDALKKKISSCAHVEFDKPEITSEKFLLDCIEKGTAYYETVYNFHGTPRKYSKRDISFLPEHVKTNSDIYDKYILR